MKKLFSFFMLLLAMFLFVGCDTPVDDDDKDDNQLSDTEINLEVSEDINEEVEVSDAAKDAIQNVIQSMVPEGEEVSNEQIQLKVAEYEEYFKAARLSNEQIATICGIIVEDDLINVMNNLINVMNSNEAPDVDCFKKLVGSLKKLVNAVGGDALGLFLYNTEVAVNEELAALVDVNTYVLESRMIMTILNSMLNSITDADVDTIYAVVTSETDPTSAQIASVVDVVEDAVNSIKITEKAWSDYYAATKEATAKIVNSDFFKGMLNGMVGEVAGVATILSDSLINGAIDLVDIMGKTTYSGLQYVKNVLAELDEATITELMKEVYIEYENNYNPDTSEYEFVEKYYVDGEEVTEEVYNNAQFAQMKASAAVFYDAYKALSDADKANLVNFVESYIKLLEDQMNEYFAAEAPEGTDIDVYKYKGETAELSEVFAKLDAWFAAANSEAADEAMEELEMTLIGYLGKNAPLFTGMIIMAGSGESQPDVDVNQAA